MKNIGDPVTCDSPDCQNVFILKKPGELYNFCRACRRRHSTFVLQTQVEHGKPIRDVILDARIFKSASNMADYIGVTFVTMYNWIRRYFDMSFQEFRRTYICRSDGCYQLNIKRSSYRRLDYLMQKIRNQRYCSCQNSMDKDIIMTNAPLEVMTQILRGQPKIEKISDKLFSLVPEPIRFSTHPKPYYYSVEPITFLEFPDVEYAATAYPKIINFENAPQPIYCS